MLNSIFDESYWDNNALSDPVRAILYGVSIHDFWNKKPEYFWLNEFTGGEVFVDIGCGIGRMAKWVSPLVDEYHGIDASEEMLKIARKNFEPAINVAFHKSTCDLSLFEDNSVDIVFTCLLFQHIGLEKSLSYIKETYRILKPSGKFYCYNIPDVNVYVDGFTKDDVDKAFSVFDHAVVQKMGPYYICECLKGECK